jgi:hypothetical protein
MIEYLNDIRKAIENDCWYSALALALTLPDICGEIEFPQITSVGKRYRQWFLNHIENNKYFIVSGHNIFSSKECYELRCSFLHSHSYDIESLYLKESVKNVKGTYFSIKNKFELYASNDGTGAKRNFSNDYSTRIQTRKIRINVYYLCIVLCDEAEKFYNTNKQMLNNVSINSIKIIN